jgi:hypothetical protein
MVENTRRVAAAVLVALACLVAFAPAQELAAQETPSLVGDWTGVLTGPDGSEISRVRPGSCARTRQWTARSSISRGARFRAVVGTTAR